MTTSQRFTDKIAVVTGASKGIGAGIARQLAAEGATVVVNYASSRAGADAVVAAIVAAGGRAVAIGANLAREDEVERLFHDVKERFGRIDVLVNNAGVYAFSPLEGITADGWRAMFETNVLGLLLATKAAVALMPTAGGAVVNIGSVVSAMAPPTGSVYAGSKGAVDVITKSLAKELAPRGIRVNAVNPGMIHTEGLVSAGMADSDFERQMVALTPLGRKGVPDDVARPVAFLASDDARYITGETLVVSGGAGM